MTAYDLPLPDLQSYQPPDNEPEDFDQFWSDTLDEARNFPLSLYVNSVPSPLLTVEVFDVSFAGWGGAPISAWLKTPKGATGPLPLVVEFNGYGGGRGLTHQHLTWCSAGYAHLIVDTRGQGSKWSSTGETPDPEGSGPSVPGFLTRGIQNPSEYYYRRVFTDGVRAVDAMLTLDVIDPARIAVCGTSQGGGIALAVAALAPQVAAAMPDVPFLCDFPRAIRITNDFPYAEIRQFLAAHRNEEDAVLRTLSYFDGVNLARRATGSALFSVALMDTTCPPSTVFAAHNRWAGPKRIEIFPFNGHEGGGGHHWPTQANFLTETLGRQT